MAASVWDMLGTWPGSKPESRPHRVAALWPCQPGMRMMSPCPTCTPVAQTLALPDGPEDQRDYVTCLYRMVPNNETCPTQNTDDASFGELHGEILSNRSLNGNLSIWTSSHLSQRQQVSTGIPRSIAHHLST